MRVAVGGSATTRPHQRAAPPNRSHATAREQAKRSCGKKAYKICREKRAPLPLLRFFRPVRVRKKSYAPFFFRTLRPIGAMVARLYSIFAPKIEKFVLLNISPTSGKNLNFKPFSCNYGEKGLRCASTLNPLPMKSRFSRRFLVLWSHVWQRACCVI